jgi:transcriptional regulator with XRE-family HTH domain
MYSTTEMSLETRQKLSELIKSLVAKRKSRREFARQIGVSASAVISWEEMTSFPDMENLKKIAKEFGCTLSELQEMLEGKQSNQQGTVEHVIYEIQQLSQKDIAKVIEAAANYMCRSMA